MKKQRNIQFISDNALCTACGACHAVCPTQAISIASNTAAFLVASVDEQKCIDCGKCRAVCPSNPANIPAANCADLFHGICLSGYVGYAADPEIRQSSQSGGIITALLCYLVERQRVNGALVHQFDPQTRRPQVVWADTREAMIAGCGSYYAQTAVIRHFFEQGKEKKVAAVLLGCQAEGLRNIRERFPAFQMPAYTIGLVCAGQNSGGMIDDLIGSLPIDSGSKTLRTFRFRDKRCGGWPGNVSIGFDGEEHVLSSRARHALKPVYESHRCLFCYDQMNIFCDVVCGDPWHIAGKDEKEGNTVVIARTERGKALLEEACRDGAIVIKALDPKRIFKGQTVDDRLKTRFYAASEISRQKDWLFPYDREVFAGIQHKQADWKAKKRLATRLQYTRKLCLQGNRKRMQAMVRKKKIQTRASRFMHTVIAFPRRCASRILRHMKAR